MLAIVDIDALERDGEDGSAKIGRSPMRPTPEQAPAFEPVAGQFRAWVVALVEPASELRARAWLWHQGQIPAWLPTTSEWRLQGGRGRRRRIMVTVPLLTRYLFVPADYYEHAIVLAAPGVHSFLMVGETPVLIPDAQFAGFRRFAQDASSGKALNPNTHKPWERGDLIMFVDDLFGGLIGTVMGLDGGGRLIVDAEGVLGRVVVDGHLVRPA